MFGFLYFGEKNSDSENWQLVNNFYVLVSANIFKLNLFINKKTQQLIMSDEKIVNYDFMKKYENSNEVLIIDVRREEEVTNTGKIGGSINIPSKILFLPIFSFLRNLFF